MICRTDISNLKTDINDKIGQKIIVKGSLGRSKEFAKEGTIEKAYSNLFVVKYEENEEDHFASALPCNGACAVRWLLERRKRHANGQ